MPNDQHARRSELSRFGKPNHVAASHPTVPFSPPPGAVSRATSSLPPVRGVAAGQPFPFGRGFEESYQPSIVEPRYLNPEWVEAQRVLSSPQTDHIEDLRIRARSVGRWRWWSITMSPLELVACFATALLIGFVIAGGAL